MQFSEYTITARPEQSIDPLGFTQPFGALRSRLFAQFTVLSNAAPYHGMLALAYQLLAQRKCAPGAPNFASSFREIESLWGLANIATDQSILNVTKYQAVLDQQETLALSNVRKSKAIFGSLAYGTLGHYSSPSIAWGFLERGGARLTELGTQLAQAFAQRQKRSLSADVEAWLNKKNFTRAELVELGQVFGVDKPPSAKEQAVWQAAIAAWCKRVPDVHDLWQAPPTESQLQQLRGDATAYQSFFPTMGEQYPRLKDVFLLTQYFEAITAVCQFLFEREYLLCHDAGDAMPEVGELEANLVNELERLCSQYMKLNGQQKTSQLFVALSASSSYNTVADTLCRHHISHQKAKNALPYMEDGQLRVRDRFNRKNFADLHEKLRELGSADEQLALLTWQYRRNWHFDRAIRYAAYARGTA